MIFDVSSIRWNKKYVSGRIRLDFPDHDFPIKVCENQYLPSYQHSLKCAGSNNDMSCTNSGIDGVRHCLYDANTSSPFPNEKNYCCLGQSSYTCCIRRCGFDNSKCYDADVDLHHVLFHKLDSEHQRYTASIGGVKSHCYTAMGNVDTSKIFHPFGKAQPQCVGGKCIQKCLPNNLLCPAKSCSTGKCFNNPSDCQYDGNWFIELSNDTLDPHTLSGSIDCEFSFVFQKDYNITSTTRLREWITDLTTHVIPDFSFVLSTYAILYQTSFIFYNDIYHLSDLQANPFNGIQYITTSSQNLPLQNYKTSIILPFQDILSKISKNGNDENITNWLKMPYVKNGFLYMPISISQMTNLTSLQNSDKMSDALSTFLSQFLQDDATSITPVSVQYQSKPRLVWNENANMDYLIVTIMDSSFNNGKVSISIKDMTYSSFVKESSANRFLLSYHVPLNIDTFSPMLVAYLESRQMLNDFAIDKIVRESGMLPLSFFRKMSSDNYRQLTLDFCERNIQNYVVMQDSSTLFLIQPTQDCHCINSGLVPIQVRYEKGFDNLTSMCFQKSCDDDISQSAYHLSNDICRVQCDEMNSWLPFAADNTDFDRQRFQELCLTSPPTPSPEPGKPSTIAYLQYWWIILIIIISVMVGIIVILNFYPHLK